MATVDKSIRLLSGKDEDGTRFFYDTTTTNRSFIQTAADLRSLGVKNNMFFLKLYDRNLIGVDPFSSSLSREDMDRIGLECVMNPWYFIRECVRIPSQGGATGPGSGDRFILHRGNLAALFCFFNCIDYYLVIPRQCYKTQSILAMLLWAFLFGTANSQFNFLSKKQTDADDNLNKLKMQRDVLPIWMQQKYKLVEDEVSANGDVKIEKGKNAIRVISNPINHNTIVTKPSATSESAAEGIGRGNSAPIQFADEVEFTDYIGTILAASGPAYYRAAENSKRNGAIYCRIASSTPGNADSSPVKDMNSIRDLAAIFTEKIYDMDSKNLSSYIDKNSQNGFTYIEFTYKQIGMDEDWFRGMAKTLNWEKMKIKREILLQRIRGSSNSPFDPEDLDMINTYRPKGPLEEFMVRGDFLLRVYSAIDKDIPYIIGVDVATGVNGDNTAVVITDPYTLKPCAVLKTPLVDEVQTAEILTDIVLNYAPRGVLCIERNNTGGSVISMLRRTKIVSHIYNDPNKVYVPDPSDKLDKKGTLVREAESRKYWGIYTRDKNREAMMEMLQLRVRDYKEDFVCTEIIDELNSLVRNSSGKILAIYPDHDDVIMAYLITLYVYQYGVKLGRYGIVKGMKKEEFESVNKSTTYEDAYEALPDKWKSLFPNPEGNIRRDVSPDINTFSNEIVASRDPEDEKIYRDIQAMQQRRAKKNSPRVTFDKEGNMLVEDEKIDEMIERARDNRTGLSGIKSSVFDICDFLNK